MKFDVIRRFRDKYTGQIYLPGDNFESDELERVEDLLGRKLIAGELPKKKKPPAKKVTRNAK